MKFLAHEWFEFTLRLGRNDWKREVRAWSCPALALPTATVKAVYVRGAPLEPHAYHVNAEGQMIHYKGQDDPEEATAILRIDGNAQHRAVGWIALLAAVVPVMVAVIQYFGTTHPLRQRVDDCVRASEELQRDKDALGARAKVADQRAAEAERELMKLRPVPGDACTKIGDVLFNGSPPRAKLSSPVKVQWSPPGCAAVVQVHHDRALVYPAGSQYEVSRSGTELCLTSGNHEFKLWRPGANAPDYTFLSEITGAAPSSAPSVESKYGFEDGLMGWQCERAGDTQACAEAASSAEFHSDGERALRMRVELNCTSKTKSKAETYVTLPGALDLKDRMVSARVYAPRGSRGDAMPHGFQVFAKDVSWRSEYGPWSPVAEEQWVPISLQVGGPTPAYRSEGFDSTHVVRLGIKFACAEHASNIAKTSGVVYVDAVNW